MRLLKKLKNGFRAVKETAAKAGATKGARVAKFFDIIYCKLRFHVNTSEYLFYRFYDFKDSYRKNFLLVYHQRKRYKYINTHDFTRSKYAFYQRIPDCYSREIILAPACGEECFLEFVKKHKTVMTKPDKGSYGRNIEVFRYESDEQALQYFRNITGDTVCEQYIQQHEVLNALNPFSVNTLRIVTLRYEDHVEIVSATLKSGGRPGSFVDNMHSNGIGAQVDVETGIVSTFGHDYEGNRYSHHPISGTQFIGMNMPNWTVVIELVKNAHSRLPQCRLLGWDIAITPDGADIIEANNAPGPLLMQIMDCVPKGEKVIKVIKESKKHKNS